MAAVLATLCLLLGGVTPALAQGEARPNPNGAKDGAGWESVTTTMVQPGESFPAKDLVAVAYGFIWVMVAGFVFSVWRRTDRLEKEIEALRTQVQHKAAGPRSGVR